MQVLLLIVYLAPPLNLALNPNPPPPIALHYPKVGALDIGLGSGLRQLNDKF